jgi:hypothetical protein
MRSRPRASTGISERWVNGYPGEDVPNEPPAEEFEPFDLGRYRALDEVPPAHVAYLRRQVEAGLPALGFVHIPHVLVAAPIDVRDCRVIAAADTPAGPVAEDQLS